MELQMQASIYAANAHKTTCHYYDGYRPYTYHLKQVISWAQKFIHHIPEGQREVIFASCWAHDIIEDARKTYNNVKDVLGYQVAEIVFALTGKKGRTRKDRFDSEYFTGICDVEGAKFIKLCDRLANVYYGIIYGGDMLDTYRKEHEKFKTALYVKGEYEDMWTELNTMIGL